MTLFLCQGPHTGKLFQLMNYNFKRGAGEETVPHGLTAYRNNHDEQQQQI